jgi:hypothetical protein
MAGRGWRPSRVVGRRHETRADAVGAYDSGAYRIEGRAAPTCAFLDWRLHISNGSVLALIVLLLLMHPNSIDFTKVAPYSMTPKVLAPPGPLRSVAEEFSDVHHERGSHLPEDKR